MSTKLVFTLDDGRRFSLEGKEVVEGPNQTVEKSEEGFGFKATKNMYNSKKDLISSKELIGALSVANNIANKNGLKIATRDQFKSGVHKIIAKFKDSKGTEQKTNFELIKISSADALLIDTNNPKFMTMINNIKIIKMLIEGIDLLIYLFSLLITKEKSSRLSLLMLNLVLLLLQPNLLLKIFIQLNDSQ
jgi:hypothetical protein